MAETVAELARHFQHIYVEHMQDLPIINLRVQVEAVGFRDFEGHELGVLITPWFMNLMLLPKDERWNDRVQGDTFTIEFPSGPLEFTISQDDALGTYLTAVLFRSVSDMPDQKTAREVAERVMEDLFKPLPENRSLSRRDLLTGLRST